MDSYSDHLHSGSEDEREPLLTNGSRSGSGFQGGSSVIDVTNITQPDIELKPNDGKLSRRWLSIYVMYFTMFLGAVTFSIVVSSLFPYLQELTDNKANTTFFGVVVAAYSLGQLIASPVFGFWSDKRPTHEPLLVSLIITVLTNLLYSYGQAFPHESGQYVLIVSRALVGFGAGNAAVARSYVSAATTESERTGAFAGISASQAIGFILGPVLALAFVPLGNTGVYWSAIRFHFNIYTGPGYLSALLAVINILLVIFVFKDRKLITANFKKMKTFARKHNDSTNVTLSYPGVNNDNIRTGEKYDRIAAYVCVVLFFAVLFVLAVYETIVTPYSMDEFAWTKTKAILYNNILFGGLAVLAIVTFIALKFVTKFIDERTVLMVGLILSAIGFFAMIPMGNEPPNIGISVVNPLVDNLTETPNYMYIPLENATIPFGCRYPNLKWCRSVPRLLLVQYIVGMVLLAVGYPTSSVLCYSIYSKILGPNPQGIMMGVLTAAGSLARTVGPLFVTFLYDVTGPQITLASIVGVLGIAILTLSISCCRLVPFGKPRGWV